VARRDRALVEAVGAIPAELQPGFTFSGAQRDSKFLASPEAAVAIIKAGLAPVS